MNQKQAEPKKIVKIMNEPISIKDSITLSEIFVKFRNRSISSLIVLMVITAVTALISAIVGVRVPLWAAIIIGIALNVAAVYLFDRKIPKEVHQIRKV